VITTVNVHSPVQSEETQVNLGISRHAELSPGCVLNSIMAIKLKYLCKPVLKIILSYLYILLHCIM